MFIDFIVVQLIYILIVYTVYIVHIHMIHYNLLNTRFTLKICGRVSVFTDKTTKFQIGTYKIYS